MYPRTDVCFMNFLVPSYSYIFGVIMNIALQIMKIFVMYKQLIKLEFHSHRKAEIFQKQTGKT